MQRVNFDAINSALMANISTHLQRWLPQGRVESHEWVALNPTRADRNYGSFRINLNTGMWADFSTSDKGGDLVSLYAYLKCNNDQGLAAKDLADFMGIEAAGKKKPSWEPIVPAPDDKPLRIPSHKLGKPVKHWEYKNAEGKLIGAICRFDLPDKKEIIPLVFCRNTETAKGEWRWQSFPKPRPLYGLDRLARLPDGNVLVVEGEKAADAAQLFFPNWPVVTWPGGSKAVKQADFTPLHGRKVLLWPDNDTPGFQAMSEVAERIQEHVEKLRFIMPPEDSAEGWDLADAVEWTPAIAVEYVRTHLSEAPPKPAQAAFSTGSKAKSDDKPFRCLGYDRAGYYYLSAGTRLVICLSPAQHSKAHLLTLAPLQYWEMEFPSKAGADWDAASNALLRWCEQAGMFAMSLVRGRGAWFDNDRIALHLGDKVIVDNEVHDPHKVPSNFIYEAGMPMRAQIDSPLSNAEASQFVKLCEVLPWDKAINARFLAGWCVLAHIGGALPWRPHIWVTGRKGSGKTHIMTDIVRPILGDNCLFVQSESTSAGIRQILAHDALPVLFEEAEGEDFAAMQRLQSVLALVRQSSSDTGGVIAKGTQQGRAMTFEVRSCFAFSSINASLVQQSDKSRVTVLEVNQDKRTINFQELLKMEDAILTPEYIRRFYARALSLADVIRKNSITFARAVAAEFGEQRAGDQIGALLAGAYSLHSRNVIELDVAVEWVKSQDWAEQRDEIKGYNDEEALWAFLRQQKIRVRLSGGEEELPIGYLIEVGTGKKLDEKLGYEKAEDMLMRNGIKPETDHVFVSNTSPHIGRMLRDTGWSNNWGKILRRLPGAEASASAVWFGYAGSEARATKIPVVV